MFKHCVLGMTAYILNSVKEDVTGSSIAAFILICIDPGS